MGESLVLTHSGSLGDIIYSIPAARELGAEGYILTECPESGARNMMNFENFSFLKDLIILQGLDCWHWTSPPYDVSTFDMDGYRAKYYRDGKQSGIPARNIAQLQFEYATKKKHSPKFDPWLKVEPARNDVILVSRTSRYQNETFPWRHLVYSFRGLLYFIGEEKDHLAFCKQYGHIPFAQLEDAYDGARLIAGSLGFVGNQSFWLSVAIGLGVNTVVEESFEFPDCRFTRGNLLYDYCPETINRWIERALA